MSYIIFENPGEIDSRLITNFGVNVKDNDSAIGFFGTGLKYALAILTRSGHEVAIQSGEREHAFGKQTIELRGKPFEFVTMDGAPLNFTTEVGKNWELWMAYRELYCNATDEGGRCYAAGDKPQPAAGATRVIVKGDKFAQIAREHDRYFLASKPFIKGKSCDVHHGSAHGVFYRGLLVGKLSDLPTRYTYNITVPVELTEDRVMRHTYFVAREIARAVIESEDKEFIRAAIDCPEHFHESRMDFDWDDEPSAAFMEVAESLVKDRVASANHSAITAYRKRRPEKKALPPAVSLNGIEQKMLDKAKAFCSCIGFEVSYPIVVVESLGDKILGMAADETIFLSQRAFMVGTKCVAGTLIEEYVHLKHRLPDCSRKLQNYLLDRVVSMGEQIIGEPL